MQGLEPLPSVLSLWQMNGRAQVTTGSKFLCSLRGALRVGAVPQHLYWKIIEREGHYDWLRLEIVPVLLRLKDQCGSHLSIAEILQTSL